MNLCPIKFKERVHTKKKKKNNDWVHAPWKINEELRNHEKQNGNPKREVRVFTYEIYMER